MTIISGEIAFLLVMLGVVAFWIKQFNDLMSIPDDRFPGQHDKIIWAATLVAFNLLGALAFWFFKTSRSKG